MIYEEIEDTQLVDELLEHQSKVHFSEVFVKFKPMGCFLPREYSKLYYDIKNMEVRDDDVWVASFPKSGTTWTQEMAWLIGQNMDYDGAKTPLPLRFPFLELDADAIWLRTNNGATSPSNGNSLDFINKMESPRYIQTHLPLNLLPNQICTNEKRPKILYVSRNPKDLCVSFYHHRVLAEGYKGTMENLVDEFVSDLSAYSPYWTHVKEFWDRRNESNLLCINYETMKEDLPSVVRATATLLGKSLTEADFETLLRHLSFESMKSNVSVNYDENTNELLCLHGETRKTHFMRKGKVGSWKEELSQESIKKLDSWIAKHKG